VLGEHLPASTLVGVAGLALPEYLIEVEAMAVLA
jgi:enamine deaminase RidA (YjgF/YER057c/UK114 family)